VVEKITLEQALDPDFLVVSMEDVLCLPKDRFGDISIKLNIHGEHGNLDRFNMLTDGESPAHVHIYEGEIRKGIEICQINITGPLPGEVNDITMYRGDKTVKYTPRLSRTQREAIYNWAIAKCRPDRAKKVNKSDILNWEFAQELWKRCITPTDTTGRYSG
jgi:hypothetical protein